jgi:hypothetical protein
MSRSRTLTKTIAIEPAVHTKLTELREAYKLRTLNDVLITVLNAHAANA